MSEQRADNFAENATPPHMRRDAAEINQPAKYRYFKYLVYEEGHNPDNVLEKNSGINKKIFIIHDESTWGYYLFDTYEDWYYDLDDKTMHKVIFGFLPQQPKFDIDAPKEFIDCLDVYAQDKGEYILESITEAISDVMHTYYDIELKDNGYAIATSTGPEKFSAHIVLKNYAVVNSREAMHLTKLLIDDHLPEFMQPIVDAGVNKSIQNFRLPYSHKVGSTQVKEPRDHGYLKEFITGHSQMIEKCHHLPPIVQATPDFEAEVADDAVNQVLEIKHWLVNPGTKGTLANITSWKEFNLFTGMAHIYDSAFEVDTNKFDLLTKHLLEVWCGGNIDHHNWLLSWLANII